MAENFHKYQKIKIVGDEENKDIFANPEHYIIIEEKMDGANFRFMVTKDGKLIFGSRTQQLTSDEGEDTNIEKNFRKCVQHIREKFAELNEDTLEHSKGKIFYGECMVKHTINYDWEKIPRYLGFDILATQSNTYLEQKNKTNMFNAWNLNIVPYIGCKKVDEIKEITDGMVPISKYASMSSQDQQAEGIVFKNYDKQLFAKYVREKFKEKNREVFGGSKKFAKTDDEYFVAVYCTNARIDKCIFKLADDGKELAMTMMGDLVRFVYGDIWEENWNEISISKKKIDLLNFKKLVSKRCLEILKQSIINNGLSKQ